MSTTFRHKRRPWSETYRWAYSQGHSTPKGESDSSNYLLLNGGAWTVPDDDETLGVMRQHLLEDARAAVFPPRSLRNVTRENFIVEKRTPFYPYILDLDGDAEMEIPEHEWESVYRVVCEVLARVYPSLTPKERRLIVLSAPSKRRMKDGVPVVKTGRHCVAPGILITNEIGLAIRDLLIAHTAESNALASCVALRQVLVEDLYDKCVYERNGMRLVYSHKAERCRDCDRRRRIHTRELRREWEQARKAWTEGDGTMQEPPAEFPKPKWRSFPECDVCAGLSFVYEDRDPYKPHDVIVYDPATRVVGTDEHELQLLRDETRTYVFEETSVRRPDATEATVYDKQLVLLHNSGGADPASGVSGGNGGRGHKRARNARTSAVRSDQWDLVEYDTEVFRVADEAVCLAFPLPQDKCAGDVHQLRVLRRTKDGLRYWGISHVKFCMNKMDYHAHSDVYFNITPSGIVQKCWSRKSRDDRPGATPCSKYASMPVRLSKGQKEVLFPEGNGGELSDAYRRMAQSNPGSRAIESDRELCSLVALDTPMDKRRAILRARELNFLKHAYLRAREDAITRHNQAFNSYTANRAMLSRRVSSSSSSSSP